MISIVTKRKCDKEINQVNRQDRSVARLTVVALFVGLVGLAGVACARHNSPAATSPAATSQAALAARAGTTSSTTVDSGTPSASITSPEESPSSSWAPTPTSASGNGATPANTPDPLDSALQGLDRIVNDVNGSISATDPGASGGE
jgi:hypothetical protein